MLAALPYGWQCCRTTWQLLDGLLWHFVHIHGPLRFKPTDFAVYLIFLFNAKDEATHDFSSSAIISASDTYLHANRPMLRDQCLFSCVLHASNYTEFALGSEPIQNTGDLQLDRVSDHLLCKHTRAGKTSIDQHRNHADLCWFFQQDVFELLLLLCWCFAHATGSHGVR